MQLEMLQRFLFFFHKREKWAFQVICVKIVKWEQEKGEERYLFQGIILKYIC